MMQFGYTYDLVMSGLKTQTRRVQRTGNPAQGYFETEVYFPLLEPLWWWDERNNPKVPGVYVIKAAVERDITGDMLPLEYEIRPKYIIGKQYAAQPGRGRKAGGRILLTGIRSERVQDITNEDALAEGVLPYPATPPLYYVPKTGVSASNPIDAYAELWDIVHSRKSERWSANPLVWVLSFCLVKDDE